MPWGLFLRSAPVWAIIVAHFCFNWGYYTLLAWLPSYFEQALGLSVDNSSFLTLVPYIAMSAMTPVVGQVADRLVSTGWKIGNVRKLAQVSSLTPSHFTPLHPLMTSPSRSSMCLHSNAEHLCNS